jgi:Family of unknown function (DUF6511)
MVRKFDPDPVCCGVCQRLAWGVGYVPPKQDRRVLWLCKNEDCLELGRHVYHMALKDLTFHEKNSLSDAGTDAGKYLEQLGKFDLASLSDQEWMQFLSIVLTKYGEHMRTRLLSHVAPF